MHISVSKIINPVEKYTTNEMWSKIKSLNAELQSLSGYLHESFKFDFHKGLQQCNWNKALHKYHKFLGSNSQLTVF